jgi:hypothetical protein
MAEPARHDRPFVLVDPATACRTIWLRATAPVPRIRWSFSRTKLMMYSPGPALAGTLTANARRMPWPGCESASLALCEVWTKASDIRYH